MRRFTLFVSSRDFRQALAMEFAGRHSKSCTTDMKTARLTCVLWKDKCSRQQHTLAQKQGRKVKFQNNKSNLVSTRYRDRIRR